ncbi:homing endonuclease associated repeat-containing protein [Candidatus Borrarchaeum sp.]|uniref:homing endonuclease associated repeat-containing protein n=1 Tax=Candidatus Borrarchaeum sp. TaxID=2846742 RepID=UPI00257B0EA7|nr:tyrosine-type recombinase/integrase [Candidatus Borrarchaeum sp.]
MGKHRKTRRLYTKEELLEKLRNWADKHGKSPTQREIEKDSSMPSYVTYIRAFGCFNNAKKMLGLKVNNSRRQYTNEELIDKLKEWAEKHGRSPESDDLDKDKTMPSSNTYWRIFGSVNNAKKLANLPIFTFDSKLNHTGELLKEWRNERKGELLENSIINYLKTLQPFEEFLNERGKEIQDLKIDDIEDYFLKIKDMYTRYTLRIKFTAFRNFFDFILRKAIIEETEPLIDIKTIELARIFFKRLIRTIDDDRIEDCALTEKDVIIIKEKLKDYPMLHNLFILDLNLGLRASEFAKIKVTKGFIKNTKQASKGDIWIDLNRGIMMIYRSKTRRPHLVSLTKEMKGVVEKQLLLRKLHGIEHEYFFFSKRGYPLQKDNIFTYYKEISTITGIKVTSHKVRRTMSTMLEKRGVPHALIRMRMGHIPKDGTQLYQRYSIEERQEIMEEKIGIL